MNLPSQKMTKDDQKLLALQKKKASDDVYRLVVKIISWKNGLLQGGTVKRANKITSKEWSDYRKHLLSISKSESQEVIMGKLKEIQQVIRGHGGFE